MKSLRVLLFSLLVAGTANAQYFQRLYGCNRNDILESGMNYDVPASPPMGYVMCGYSDCGSTAAGVASPMVVRTLLNGAVFPGFNNTYPLNFFGRPVDAAARRVITYPNGQVGVIGDWSWQPGAQHTNIFYMLLNPNGTVGNVWTYFFPNVQFLEATSITASVAPAPQQNMYACGNITDFSGRRYPFTLNIQAYNGIVNWGYDYADVGMGAFDWTVEDLIESPYPNAVTGMLDIALVGRYSLQPAAALGQGCLYTLDAGTGTPSSRVLLYGMPNNEDNFKAITIANNPFNGGTGYAIAGSTIDNTVPAPNSNMWALKVAPNGFVQFTSQMDYSMGNRNDYGFDIIERLSPTAGVGYQYFVGGSVDQGFFGGEDKVVYKLDFAGNPYPGPGGLNQFTWGGPGRERILQLDYYQNGVPANNVGLSTFGWTVASFPLAIPPLGQTDFYHVKSYFNGITPIANAGGGVGNCNHNEQFMNWMPGPPIWDSTKCDTMFRPKKDSLMWMISSQQNVLLCMQNAVAGGSNVRLANSGDFGVNSSALFPNPVSTANPVVNLTFDVPGVGDVVDIELWNTLGQLVMHKQVTFDDGATQLEINLGSGLSAGVYNLTVRRGGEMINHKISVQ